MDREEDYIEARINSISEKYNVDIDTLNKQMSEIDSDPNEAEIFSLDPDYENKTYDEYKLDLIENSLKPAEHIENNKSNDKVITDPFEEATNVAINKNNILEILENNTDIDFKEMDDNYEIYSMASEKVNLESNNIDETLDEFISNRNIIDPTSYYSESERENYKNLNSQENKIMYKVAEEYEKLNSSNFDSNNHFDELNNIKKQVSNAKDLHSYAVNNFDNINNLNFNVDENNKLNLSFSSNNKEVNLSKDNNNDIVQNENNKLQKLKSVELEKNVIGLLPKEEQQNNFKETLSRLEKNKSDLVSHLKEQLGINKVNDIIKSVKDNFENIKVKAEDIHQTFKDLGNWNTNNNFVKNIDNVVVSIKELGKKHENELLQSDSKSIMNKLSKEYNELKNFVNKAESENKLYNQKNEVRNNFIKDTLKLNGVNTEINSKELLENLSDNQKTDLYNYLKDTNSHYKNLSTDSSMEKEYQNNVLIKDIEKQMPEVIKNREEYLATNPKVQTLNFDNSNDKIKEFIDTRNNDIKNMSKNDRTNSTVNQKQELNISKQNNKSNQIKNNDMFKKMNRIEAENLEQTQNETKKKSNSIVR